MTEYIELTDELKEKLKSKDLGEAHLYKANLIGANLERAYLERANLYKANLRRAYLYKADLRGADLEGADLEGADLEEANLEDADLEGANLRGANLRGANLYKANLKGADLRGARLEGADLERADLHDIKNKNILIFQFNKHFSYYCDGFIKIGCETHASNEWLTKYKELAEENKYSELETKMYLNFIKQCIELGNYDDNEKHIHTITFGTSEVR